MKIKYQDIINKHKGKTAIVVGLGPSLRANLEFIENIDKSKYVVFCCNLFQEMTSIDADYWLISNSQVSMQVKAITGLLDEYKGVFIYNNDIDRSEENLITPNYIKMCEEENLPLIVSQYCGVEKEAYAGVETVAIHLTALGIITGCKEVLITGVDLDYTNGYVKEVNDEERLKLGQSIMPKMQKSAIDMIKTLKNLAANIGVEVLCFPGDNTKLGQEIGTKKELE